MDPKILMSLKSLVVVQTKPKTETAKQITSFLNCRTTHQGAIREYRKCGNILHIYSDASYTSELEAQSKARRCFFLLPKSNTPIQKITPENGPVHVECRIMRNIMASASEVELGGLFENYQKATSTSTALEEVGHQEPPTPAGRDNIVANSIVNGTAKQEIS